MLNKISLEADSCKVIAWNNAKRHSRDKDKTLSIKKRKISSSKFERPKL